MLSDTELYLAEALGLPTFEAGGRRLFKRLTLVICGGEIEHVFYPVFPPNEHAQRCWHGCAGAATVRQGSEPAEGTARHPRRARAGRALGHRIATPLRLLWQEPGGAPALHPLAI